MGGYNRGLLTILRRADTESARCPALAARLDASAHSEQMSWSGSAGGAVGGNACEERSERTLPHRGTLVPRSPTPVALPARAVGLA